MSENTIERPTSDDPKQWQTYWTAQGEPWRTEPEISPERQQELAQRRDTVQPDIEKGIYPFKDVRLSRADVEWLLHEHHPIDWSDEAQRERDGLDLRSALLNETAEYQPANLSALPLSRTRFALNDDEWFGATPEQQEAATAHLEGANLSAAHLEGAGLYQAHLEGANLYQAHLEGANLSDAHLEGAFLRAAHLEGADLSLAHLEGANLSDAHLEGADLYQAHLEGASLRAAHLEGADLRAAHLEGADLRAAHLEGADLRAAHLEGADLRAAHLEGANLSAAHLEGKTLSDADYQRIQAVKREFGITVPQQLPPANLRLAFFSEATTLNDLIVGDAHQSAYLADVRWGGVNLAVIPWTTQNITILGDEATARKTKDDQGKQKEREQRIREWEAAVRAYRQLAVALRAQGMNEIADIFAYRGRCGQQQVLRLQKKRGESLWNRFLDLTAGYGFKPQRTLIAYVTVISFFAALFWALSVFWQTVPATHPVTWYEAITLSFSSFHGRGFFPSGINTGDPLATAAVFEAVFGLFIEVSFIATFTQRFFSR
jgi:uncharacterized protein YjbI with pentapeptide repeats